MVSKCAVLGFSGFIQLECDLDFIIFYYRIKTDHCEVANRDVLIYFAIKKKSSNIFIARIFLGNTESY